MMATAQPAAQPKPYNTVEAALTSLAKKSEPKGNDNKTPTPLSYVEMARAKAARDAVLYRSGARQFSDAAS